MERILNQWINDYYSNMDENVLKFTKLALRRHVISIIGKDTFFKIFGSGAFNGETPNYTSSDVEALIAFSRTFYPKTVIEIGIQRGPQRNVF
ncbi:hypothetical protein [Peribacillus butanolivorans]|uniref:hypothetical protein n=1 Tax=Peribacillus butanolivorans TaxID=421767 RepID=UPI0036DE30A5